MRLLPHENVATRIPKRSPRIRTPEQVHLGALLLLVHHAPLCLLCILSIMVGVQRPPQAAVQDHGSTCHVLESQMTSCWNSTWAGGPARQSAASCPLGCCARGVGPVGSLTSLYFLLCGPKPPRGFQTIWSGLCPRIPAQVYGLCPYWARYWVSLSLSPILAQCHQS